MYIQLELKSKKNIIFFLLLIIFCSLPLKLYTFDFSLPEMDSWWYVTRGIGYNNGDYAETAIQTSGYPLFLSIFFKIVQPNEYVDYVNVARILNIILSSATIFPLYLLARRFFDKKLSFLLPIFFAFQPQLNHNTGQVLSESLFLLILISSYLLLLNKNSKSSHYISFFLLGLLFWVRFTGLGFVLPFLICYTIIYRNPRKLLVCFLIFLLVISPILFLRYEQYGNPLYFSGLHGTYKTDFLPDFNEPSWIFVPLNRLLIAWATLSLPYLIFFFPLGMYFSRTIQDNRKNFHYNWILFVMAFVPLIIFYNVGAESRPLFHIYPFLMIFSVLAIQSIIHNRKRPFTKNQKKIFILLVLIFVVGSSTLVTHGWKNYGYGKQDPILINEIRKYTAYLLHDLEGNLFWSKGLSASWIHVAMIESSNGEFKNYKFIKGVDIEATDMSHLKKYFPTNLTINVRIKGDSIDDFLLNSEKHQIDYISVGDTNELKILDQIYEDEEKFPYLIKIFDSSENGFQKYKVKLFKMDYEKFHQLKDIKTET